LERWVEIWFFDRRLDEFDPEADIEVYGYPARPVVDVPAGEWL
jgi:hypothetical protein